MGTSLTRSAKLSLKSEAQTGPENLLLCGCITHFLHLFHRSFLDPQPASGKNKIHTKRTMLIHLTGVFLKKATTHL